MTEETAGERLTALRMEITQLTARAAELHDTLATEPAAPPPAVIEHLQTYLTTVITSGTPGERKTAIEALVAEIGSPTKESSPCSESPDHTDSSPAREPAGKMKTLQTRRWFAQW